MRARYYLEFDDIAGTELTRFATFRLSGSWAKRLKKRDVVLLADVKLRQIYGTAKVLDVHVGRVRDMLELHAQHGHLALAHGESAEVAPDKRFASMMRRYGPHRFGYDSILSVIYLKRAG
jgi:hypothetical protein